LDCPSGINCDTGEAALEAIPAEVTFTMAGIKMGMLKFPAANLIGTIQVGSIGNLTDVIAWNEIKRGVITGDDVFPNLPTRALDAHKGTFGTALIVAGSGNYPGAMLLAGEAAYRIGAGLVTIAIPDLIYPAVAGVLREATWLRLPHTDGWIDKDSDVCVSDILPRVNALLVGPGVGLNQSTGVFLESLIHHPLPPSIFDADGLKLLARIPEWQSIISETAILTPHPGEMSVLTGLAKEEIQSNRVEIAEVYAKKWTKVVVLKGAYTVIADPHGTTAIVPIATPALARAGTGDVLAGLIVGLLAQGMDKFQAAYMGAYIHAMAGLAAEIHLGHSASVLASDVVRMIPGVITK
jgi:NAD(P)H-hydrate epimerase